MYRLCLVVIALFLVSSCAYAPGKVQSHLPLLNEWEVKAQTGGPSGTADFHLYLAPNGKHFICPMDADCFLHVQSSGGKNDELCVDYSLCVECHDGKNGCRKAIGLPPTRHKPEVMVFPKS